MPLILKPAVKEKWLAALRSGRYMQGFSQLRTNNIVDVAGEPSAMYCCLGVLCDLAAEEGVGAWTDVDDEHGGLTPAFDPQDGDPKDAEVLPRRVAMWAFDETDPPANWRDPLVSVPGGPSTSLSGLNDGGLSFEYIADRIEASL